MGDVYTKIQRSRNMAAIRSRGNKSTEQKFLKILKENKIVGWRRHKRNLPGTPDFVFLKKRIVIFIDGCFWHGCKKHFSLPHSNKDFWSKKIKANAKRDRINRTKLVERGWKVLKFWEHEIKKNSQKVLKKLENSKIIKI